MAVILIQHFSGAGLSSRLKSNNDALQRIGTTYQSNTYHLHMLRFVALKVNLPIWIQIKSVLNFSSYLDVPQVIYNPLDHTYRII